MPGMPMTDRRAFPFPARAAPAAGASLVPSLEIPAGKRSMCRGMWAARGCVGCRPVGGRERTSMLIT
jgi:hypothetical protein